MLTDEYKLGDVILQGDSFWKKTDKGWRELTPEEINNLPPIDLNTPLQITHTNYVYRNGEMIKDIPIEPVTLIDYGVYELKENKDGN